MGSLRSLSISSRHSAPLKKPSKRARNLSNPEAPEAIRRVYLGLADQYNAAGQSRDGSLFLNAALNAVDLAIGFVPGLSLGYDLLQIRFGYNPLTGEKLSDLQRGVLIGTLFIPSALSGAGKTVVKLAGFLKKMAGNKLAGDLLKVINKSDEAASKVLGRAPCIVQRSPMEKIFHTVFGIATAYACSESNLTDEILKSTRKIGVIDTDNVKAIANAVSDSTFIRKTSTGLEILAKSGGFKKATEDWSKHKFERIIKDDSNIKIGQTNENVTVIVRLKSSDGRPTLEYQRKTPSNETREELEIRYDD
jgi:hypothetical protein